MSPNVTIDSIRVLVPGTGPRFRCGGLSVALQTARLLGKLRPTELVTYRAREAEHSFLDDVLAQEASPGNSLWLVSWGFDVPATLKKLRGRPALYQAHSSGYGFDLPPGVPVVAVSRNTLGYWGNRAPRNPLFLVPNALEHQWLERGARPTLVGIARGKRPIDVLVQQRKSSTYVLNTLVPALRARGLTVEVQSGWVDDLVALFNSASVYLYDSAEYWRGRGVSEGFGLPPLEALACGCVVFSSFNHALSDTLTPGKVGHQIGCGSLSHDVERVVAAVADPVRWRPDSTFLEALLEEHSEQVLQKRWNDVLQQLDVLLLVLRDASVLRAIPLWQLRMNRCLHGLKRVANRLPGWPAGLKP